MAVTSAAQALRDAAALLAAVSATPRLDAELLMAHAAGVERQALLLALRDREEPDGFAALVEQRMTHRPVAHITGTRDFWTISLTVTPDVLIPRPDTETLMERAVAHFGDAGPARILDLGTGSGALLLAALDQWPGARGLGVDASDAALAVARDNAARLGLADRAEFRLGDWGAGLTERFDLILCNPPYIADGTELMQEVADHEPHTALFAGMDGLDDYRLLAGQTGGLLASGGLALFEIGHDQRESAAALFAARGFAVRVVDDLAGQPRCLIVRERG